MNVALAARENCEVVRMTCYDYSYLVGTTRELLEVSEELARVFLEPEAYIKRLVIGAESAVS